MISLVVITLLFWHYQNLLDQGSKYHTIIWPPSNNQWQSFICLSYLLEKMCYFFYIHINDSLGAFDAFILRNQYMISQSYKWFY